MYAFVVIEQFNPMTAAATPPGEPGEGGVHFGPLHGEMRHRDNHQLQIRFVAFNGHKIYHALQQTLCPHA